MISKAGITAVLSKAPLSFRNVASICALVVIYIALESVSSLHDYGGLPFTAWDPGLGALFVALIKRPAVGSIALFIGITGSETLLASTPLHWTQVLSIASIITLTYLAIALVLTRRTAFNPELPGVADIMRLLSAGLSGAVISGTLMTALFLFSGELSLAEVSGAAFSHVVGDAIGIAVTTPLLLRLMATYGYARARTVGGMVPDVLMFATTTALYFWLIMGAPLTDGHRYFYLLFIPAVFTAVRHGLTGATCVLALTQFTLVIFLNRFDFNEANFTAHQSMMLALTATALLVGSIVSERNFMEAEAQIARSRVAALTEASTRAARFNLVNGMASVLSHELNQPLTAARARARIIEHLSTNARIDGLRDQLTMLVDQIDAAAAILQRVRHFLSKSGSSETVVAWQEITDRTRDLMELSVRRDQVTLNFSPIDEPVFLRCDPLQIEQVLANLIGNSVDAIVAAGIKGGCIEVGAETTGDGAVEAWVRDNGPGIPADKAARIFDPLVTTKADGLGLGLAISAMIVESHLGRIWIESAEAGRTEFRFRLPPPGLH